MGTKLVILEGHRAAGKTSVTRHIRETVNHLTWINPTGYPDKGEEGLLKMIDYYSSWIDFLWGMSTKPNDFTVLFDRFYMSELVYSSLYKDYDFMGTFDYLNYQLRTLNMEVHFVQLEVADDAVIESRLSRDKVSFEVEDTLEQIDHQRTMYQKAFTYLKDYYEALPQEQKPNWHFHLVDGGQSTPEQLSQEIVKLTNLA